MPTRFRPRDIGAARNARGIPFRESIELAPGAGITAGSGTIYRSWVRRSKDSRIIYTDIIMDLTGLSSSTTDTDIIGTAGVCHIGQITAAVNGTIIGGSMTCLEAPAGGVTDIDLYAATEGTGAYDALVTGLTETIVVSSTAAWTIGRVLGTVADGIAAGAYLYLACGAAGTAATYTAGRIRLSLVGYEA